MRRTSVGLASLVALLAGLGAAACGAQAAVLGAAPGSAPSAGLSAGQQRAFLVRGAAAVKGLPFFSPNVLPALVGSYALGVKPQMGAAGQAVAAAPGSAELQVWYTREPLVLGSAWKRADGFGPAAQLLSRPQGGVLLVKAPRYYLFFELPPLPGPAAEDQGRRAFIRAFDRKFSAFFENAPSDAELSFPAFVDY